MTRALAASVVITCYNLERYIGAAIDSVLGQDFVGRVDIIVVDDCSTDGSAEVISSYRAVQYRRMPTNSGVLLAMLDGVGAARSDILFFLDGDDCWEPHKLSRCVAEFERNPELGFVTHDLTYIDADGQPLVRRSRVKQTMHSVSPDEISPVLRKGILEIDDFVWLGSAFGIRKSVANFDGFHRFATALPDPANTYQDWPLAYWIAAQPGVALGYVPDKLFRYRLHRANHSGDAGTPVRAIRNLTRTLNTYRANADIARIRNLDARIQRILADRIEYCTYGIELARGHRTKAFRGFFRSLPELHRRGLVLKEVVRFLAVQVIGPTRFAELSSRRTNFRNLPAT